VDDEVSAAPEPDWWAVVVATTVVIDPAAEPVGSDSMAVRMFVGIDVVVVLGASAVVSGSALLVLTLLEPVLVLEDSDSDSESSAEGLLVATGPLTPTGAPTAVSATAGLTL
jgi:hypothetical protein